MHSNDSLSSSKMSQEYSGDKARRSGGTSAAVETSLGSGFYLEVDEAEIARLGNRKSSG
jgi:hypothetical protein